MAGRLLAADGHSVVLHARNETRADDTRAALPEAAGVVVGDLTGLAGMRQVAAQASAAGPFDAVIHNAGIGYREPRRVATEDGLAHVFAVNVLAPYLLTALIGRAGLGRRPGRLVYLSSGMHRGGDASLDDPQWERRRWNGAQAYADSKLFDTVLAFAVARRWPGVRSNAVEPGWVPTRMGGPGATGRHVAGPGDAGLAGGQRRPGGHRHRRVLLPPATAGRLTPPPMTSPSRRTCSATAPNSAVRSCRDERAGGRARAGRRGGRGPVRLPGAGQRAVRLGARAGRLPGSGSGGRGHANLVRAVLGDDRDRHRGSRARHHRQRPDRPPAGRAPRLRDPGHPGRAAHAARGQRVAAAGPGRGRRPAVRRGQHARVHRRAADRPGLGRRPGGQPGGRPGRLGRRRRGHHRARRGDPGRAGSPGVVRLPGRRRLRRARHRLRNRLPGGPAGR